MGSDEDELNPVFKKLSTLIEALTHSGSNTLDEELFKQVKKICKTSEIYIPKVYNCLFMQLKKKNSQIRFLAFLICTELFKRSALFREHFLKDLEVIYKLTAEINSKSKLPPPKTFAETLKRMAIKTLQVWVIEFGETYKQLKIAYNYFKNCKKINFETFEIESDTSRIHQMEYEKRQKLMQEEKAKQAINEMKSYQQEIDETVISLENCLKLLVPSPQDFYVSTLEDNSEKEEHINDDDINQYNLQHFGITTNYKISLHINPAEKIKINKTEENCSIIVNAKDCVRLIYNRFLPLIKKWSHILSKCSNLHNNHLKVVLDIKQKLYQILEQYKALDIDDTNLTERNSSDDSADEFEEVKKEGYEDSANLSEEDLLAINNHHTIIDRPLEPKCGSITDSSLLPSATSNGATPVPSTSKQTEPTDRKSKLLKVAPKLPFDIDLYHWEDESLTTPTLISTKMDVDKFWGCATSDDIHIIPNPEGVAALRTRVIEFTGKFEPVKWACRAPLGNGKLCPRKDRFKCPFHGKIVARDETGKCKNPEDEKNIKLEQHKKHVPEWQDPQLLADIKASTGIDLKMPEHGKSKRKSENHNLTHKKMKTSAAALEIVKTKHFPGLVDVVRKQNTTYTRLSKKLFNRSTVKRVCATLNKMDKKKFKDKFSDCFNYA